MLTLRELKRSIEFRSAYGELPVTYMDHDARHFSGDSSNNKITKKLPEVDECEQHSNENVKHVEISYDPVRKEFVCHPIFKAN